MIKYEFLFKTSLAKEKDRDYDIEKSNEAHNNFKGLEKMFTYNPYSSNNPSPNNGNEALAAVSNIRGS